MKTKFCRQSCTNHRGLVSSKPADNKFVQDRSKKMVIVGSDVVGLYLALRKNEAAEEGYQSVMEADISWE